MPWPDARDHLLATLTELLARDTRVVGAGLVGSFGRGEADEWSDLDLLVVVDDTNPHELLEQDVVLPNAALVFPAPQNTRATAASAGSLHVVDGWPVGVDWYVHLAQEATWPSDCTVLFGEERVGRSQLPFREWNAIGPRGTARTFTDHERALALVAMVPIAGKQVARAKAPASDLDELEELVRRDAPPALQAPLLRYLAEVRRHIEEAADPGGIT